MSVRQGDIVEAGQVLARLQVTKFKTAVDDLQDKIDALEIKRARLEVEIEGGREFTVSADLAARSPDILLSEQSLLVARNIDFTTRRDGAVEVLEQAEEEQEMMERMYRDKVVALIEVNRTRKATNDAQIKFNEIVTQTKLERAKDYSEVLQDLTSIRQDLRLSNDQLGRTEITSPLRGIVNSLNVTTIGGVIRPGEEIFEIIPLDEELFVEARVRPENIANVERGQPATVKLSAYDYTIYGTLQGKVDFVSADTFEDKNNPKAEPYYKVTVQVDRSKLTDRQRDIEIRPGMRAVAELRTGSKTILKYLLKPLYKSKQAFREP